MDGATGAAAGSQSAAERRLWGYGAVVLSDEELVGILGGVPPRTVSAWLEHGFKALLEGSAEEVMERTGLSERAVSRLLVAPELGRRMLKPRAESRPQMSSPDVVASWARRHLGLSRREEFHVLCINSRNVLVRHACVAVGSVDQCHVDPREVLAPAVTSRATAIIVVHNHPAGDPTPSAADLALTRQLTEAARVLCIRLADHVVVCESSHVSMAQKGLLNPTPPRILRIS